MAETETSDTTREEVDIGEESRELETYSDGSLERLDRVNRIKIHWFKEKIIVWLSAIVIMSVLIGSFSLIVFAEDETARDWAMQSLSALFGFAAGAIWQSKPKD